MEDPKTPEKLKSELNNQTFTQDGVGETSQFPQTNNQEFVSNTSDGYKSKKIPLSKPALFGLIGGSILGLILIGGITMALINSGDNGKNSTSGNGEDHVTLKSTNADNSLIKKFQQSKVGDSLRPDLFIYQTAGTQRRDVADFQTKNQEAIETGKGMAKWTLEQIGKNTDEYFTGLTDVTDDLDDIARFTLKDKDSGLDFWFDSRISNTFENMPHVYRSIFYLAGSAYPEKDIVEGVGGSNSSLEGADTSWPSTINEIKENYAGDENTVINPVLDQWKPEGITYHRATESAKALLLKYFKPSVDFVSSAKKENISWSYQYVTGYVSYQWKQIGKDGYNSDIRLAIYVNQDGSLMGWDVSSKSEFLKN